MLEDINALISKLDWSTPIDTPINQLLRINDNDVGLLVQPMEQKYWDNSAKILKNIGYPRNKLAIPGLLEWLQDLNWPGAQTAMETLQKVNALELLAYLETAIQKALEENDDMWIMALKELVINRMSIEASYFKNQELYKIIEQFE